MTITIRSEAPGDEAGIRRPNQAAFPGPEEAEIVDRLRAVCGVYTSFVAVDGEEVVGHILFTPVILEGARPGGMGLGDCPLPGWPPFPMTARATMHDE